MKRRFFITSAAALAALPMTPAKTIAFDTTAESRALTVGVAEVAAPMRTPWWGFSVNGGEYWHDTGAKTKEEAMAYAKEEHPDQEVMVGLCHPEIAHFPDYRDDIVAWLNGDFGGLDRVLQDGFEGANCDVDYEGEVGDASTHANWHTLALHIIPLIERSLERNGIFIVGEIEEGCLKDCDHAQDLIATDKVLEREIEEAIKNWGDYDAMILSPIMVGTSDEETFVPPEEIAADAKIAASLGLPPAS